MKTLILIPHFFTCVFLFFPIALSSCASAPPNVQPQVNSLIVANKADRALDVLESQKDAYGKNNELLYLLDKAFVLHLAKRYEESISYFALAQEKFDELYTKSISQGLATWVINDYLDSYHGEDFEHILVNVFQALNYAVLNNFEDALVEARDVDSKLSLINSQYSPKQKNVYREDAFARLLMGILYAQGKTPQDYNDAFISYRKAVEIYSNDYLINYGLGLPKILQESILSAASYMGVQEFNDYRKRFLNAPYLSLHHKRKKAQVFLIQYNGLSPIKVQNSIPIPLPGGIITKLAFPSYHERFFEIKKSIVIAEPANQAGPLRGAHSETELVEDIGKIAVKNLENRQVRVMAKAVLRPAGKYFAERATQEMVRKKYGNGAATRLGIAGSLFNLVSEQADLRSWQTLPAEIRMARLILDAGQYDIRLNNFDDGQVLLEERSLGTFDLQEGDLKFFIVRTVR